MKSETDWTADKKNTIAARLRQLGLDRVLWESDAFILGNAVCDAYRAFRMLPLTEAEFRTIEQNEPPYMRW